MQGAAPLEEGLLQGGSCDRQGGAVHLVSHRVSGPGPAQCVSHGPSVSGSGSRHLPNEAHRVQAGERLSRQNISPTPAQRPCLWGSHLAERGVLAKADAEPCGLEPWET